MLESLDFASLFLLSLALTARSHFWRIKFGVEHPHHGAAIGLDL